MSAAVAALCLACQGGPEPVPDSVESSVRTDSMVEGLAILSDTLRTILDQLLTPLEPIDAMRERARVELRADFATPAADSLFLAFRREAVAEIGRLAPAFRDAEIQSAVYPGGAGWSQIRYERGEPRTEPDSMEIARADTIAELLLARGVRMRGAEGDAWFEIAEAGLLDDFGRFVSEEVRAFLRLWAQHQERPIAEDAAVVVAPDELARRIAAMEHYLETYPTSPVRDPVESRYHWYLWIYFEGLPNTPAFERGTGHLRAELRHSYERYVAESGSTRSGRLTTEYLRLLEGSGFTRSRAIEDFLRERRDAFETHLLRY